MYTLREVGEMLGFTRARLMQLIQRGEIQSEKRFSDEYGSQRFISRSSLESFVHAREEAARQAHAEGKRPRGGQPKVPKLPD